METLGSRVQWILDNRTAPDGEKWDAKKLSQAAGLSPSHVGQIARGDVQDPASGRVVAIAAAARVSLVWLLTGKGSPDALDEPPVDSGVRPNVGGSPHWPGLLATAKALDPSIPAWALERTAQVPLLLTAPLTAAMVVEIARMVMKFETPPSGKT